MPYIENDHLLQPQDENMKVWRYMDFTKFISILQNSELYFSRADKFEDQFEGSFTSQNYKARVNNAINYYIKELSTRMINEIPYDRVFHNWRRFVAINCWHLNNYESTAMWSLYLTGNEGIAIQSTYKKLKQSFEISKKHINIGQVNYIDYGNAVIDDEPINRFFHKRISFSHENEVRAVITELHCR